MFRASSAHHQESLTVHTASSFCVCVCLRHCLVSFLRFLQVSYKTVPQTDTNTETGGCMYGEGFLMMSAWRSKHVEFYTYRWKIKIYHKLHLLVYLLEYMKMHGPGNIKKSYHIISHFQARHSTLGSIINSIYINNSSLIQPLLSNYNSKIIK
jgi:hypothetical protein